MLKNNFIIAFRSLKKNWSFTLSNLTGLVIGITCCLLILSFVKYETSFDRFHTKSDRIYRVNYDVMMGGEESISPSVPVFAGPEMKRRFPEVADATRFSPGWSGVTVRRGNIFFDEKGFCYADPNFFKVLDFKALSGDLRTALYKPHTLVITSDMATKYFGKENPVGKKLLLNNKDEYQVAAVIENVPANSHFSFDLLTSFYSIPGFDSLETKIVWNNPNYSTFLLLQPHTNVRALSDKIENWVNPPEEQAQTASKNSLHLRLESLADVHFNTEVFNYQGRLAITDFKYIKIFITIAILVLLIACANYINLSTAKASGRSKEVGIRKTIGASFRQLFIQFITESFLLVLCAVGLSAVAVYLLLPSLNNLLGKQIPFYIFDAKFLLSIAAGIVIVSLLAGFYPSLVLSKFRPVETLKGAYTARGGAGVFIRKSLVVLQFTISVALILGTIIVRSQLKYMQTEKLGFDKDHVLIIHGNADLKKNLETFSEELKKVSGVEQTALTWRSPFETVIGNGFSLKSNPTSDDDWHVVGGIAGSQDYLSALDISLIAGRNFDPGKIKGDSTVNEYLVNESFLQHYNLTPQEAVGKEVILGMTGKGPIVGVMKDFHVASMHERIAPVVLFNNSNFFSSVLVRVGRGEIASTLDKIGNVWKRFAPTNPFNYSFLDEEYDTLYRTETRLGVLMSMFCGLAILITCLGLLGLMAFIVAQRTKEVGIRKVLGASVTNITALLSKDFLRLVIIAVIIAIPLSWYFLHKWLEDFAYRVNIGWFVFFITALLAVLIAFITISFQAIKAAVVNPVKSLRTE